MIRPWWGRLDPSKVSLKHLGRLLESVHFMEDGIFHGPPGPLDTELRKVFRSRKQMGKRDRATVSEAVYSLYRNGSIIKAAADKAGHIVQPGDYLKIALFDVLENGETYCPEGLKATLHTLSIYRGMLLQDIANNAQSSSSLLADGLSELFSVPRWLVLGGIWETVGEAATVINSLKFPQQPTLRVNVHLISRKDLSNMLDSRGIWNEPTKLSPYGLRLAGRVNLDSVAPEARGLWEMQDEGSQLIAMAAGPAKGRILDYCAGAGGKSLAIASIHPASGRVIAHDIRIKPLRETISRAKKSSLDNVSSIEFVPAGEKFETVVVDAPCSSTGTLRRNPEVVYRWNAESIGRFAHKQLDILRNSSKYVASGGTLLYATCSLMREENEAVVERFLGGDAPFSISAIGKYIPVEPSSDGMVKLSPALDGYSGDGFFVARMKKDRI